MRKLILNSIYLVLLSVSMQCKKDKEPISQLPPESQTGANTFGCLVNGQVFVPHVGSLSSSTLTCYYQYIYPSESGYVFHISATDNRESDNLKSVAINIDSIKLNKGMSVQLNLGQKGISGQGQRASGNVAWAYRFYTSTIYTGLLTFTKFDEISQIASGIFWFNAVNSFGDTVKITDGRFDVKFTR